MKGKPAKKAKRPDKSKNKPKDSYKASMEKMLFLNKGGNNE